MTRLEELVAKIREVGGEPEYVKVHPSKIEVVSRYRRVEHLDPDDPRIMWTPSETEKP